LGIDPRRFNSNKPACLKLRADSDIRIEEQVERSSLRLQVSPEALLNQLQYANGGKALMVNYDARRYQYQPRNGEDHHSQTLTSKLGLISNSGFFAADRAIPASTAGAILRDFTATRSMPFRAGRL